MVTLAFLSILLSAGPNDGSPASSLQPLDAAPVADESPTAWSCTVDTLRAGRECVFEAELTAAEPSRDQAASNLRLVQGMGRTLCTEAARPRAGEGTPDRALTALCEKKYASAAERCTLEGAVSVVDAKGRFAPAARACYQALSKALQETQMMASVASPCCQCAAQRGCAGAGDQCYSNLIRQEAAASTLACMRERCAEACSLVPPASSAGKALPSVPKSEPRPGRGSASL
jgi:hypothetical protein